MKTILLLLFVLYYVPVFSQDFKPKHSHQCQPTKSIKIKKTKTKKTKNFVSGNYTEYYCEICHDTIRDYEVIKSFYPLSKDGILVIDTTKNVQLQ